VPAAMDAMMTFCLVEAISKIPLVKIEVLVTAE